MLNWFLDFTYCFHDYSPRADLKSGLWSEKQRATRGNTRLKIGLPSSFTTNSYLFYLYLWSNRRKSLNCTVSATSHSINWQKEKVFHILIMHFLFIFFHFIYLLLFFSFVFISRRLITLQYCSGFYHTLTWISHGFTCILHPLKSPICLMYSINTCWQKCQFSKEITSSKLNPYTTTIVPLALFLKLQMKPTLQSCRK